MTPIASSPATPNRPAAQAPSGATQGELTFRTYQGPEGLAQARRDWVTVLEGMTHTRCFQYPEWYAAFATTAMEAQSLRVFVAYRGGAPVGVLPLCLTSRAINGIPVRTLAFPDNPHLAICDFAFERSPENANLVDALIAHLRRSGQPWDLLFVRAVLEDSSAWFSVSAAQRWSTYASPAPPSDYLDSTPFDERLALFSKNFRAALRKARNKLNQEQNVEFVRCTTPHELELGYEEFLAVEGSGWKGAAGTAINSDRGLIEFYRALMRQFGAIGGCEINLLRVGGTCVAAQFCLKIDRWLYILKIGYDESRSRLAPGNMLLENVVRRAQADGEIDNVSLVSNASWHGDWKPKGTPRHTTYLFNTSVRGTAAHFSMVARDRLRPLFQRWIKPKLTLATTKVARLKERCASALGRGGSTPLAQQSAAGVAQSSPDEPSP